MESPRLWATVTPNAAITEIMMQNQLTIVKNVRCKRMSRDVKNGLLGMRVKEESSKTPNGNVTTNSHNTFTTSTKNTQYLYNRISFCRTANPT